MIFSENRCTTTLVNSASRVRSFPEALGPLDRSIGTATTWAPIPDAHNRAEIVRGRFPGRRLPQFNARAGTRCDQAPVNAPGFFYCAISKFDPKRKIRHAEKPPRTADA